MKINKLVSWIAVFSWMAVIFYLSHQPGSASSHLSSGIVTALLSFIDGVAPQLDIDIESFHTFIRKNAHFIAYFLLGLLSLNAWRSSGFRGAKQLMLSFGLSVLFAITDEVHQLFIEGRSGEVRDVLIDSSGVGLSVLVYVLFSNLWDSKKVNTIKRNIK
ncbi:acetobutylicum phosphotransbutyrylase [Planococcus halocryophilus Or1]|uniref:VanZ family protein n=1 Tax=Planococcus halocryophilus TaxID=1215089 RepID=A0A1C7DRU0_9BACL|nr:VanZ family protein [Planococcus halocryophilus]ANU13913.1 VanZ family protein [Planococcus halocryophilus]EMF47496.1 acetobutylicum phosphotransbutyrylase [Planococcus halocryophilus Or1]